ncbi:MAG: TIGR03905 family TSCPD domain-containing protein [Ruminococcaceae bacterium]|nr:TIGR03905 family TSCPD domain-containing protein [Oscillospiraceae bacterium]
MRHTFRTKKTCSSVISFDLEGNVVKNVVFTGGCNGNLKAISSLVDGLTVEEIENKVRGIKCGFKDTSCSDQLAIAVRSAYEEENTK